MKYFEIKGTFFLIDKYWQKEFKNQKEVIEYLIEENSHLLKMLNVSESKANAPSFREDMGK